MRKSTIYGIQKGIERVLEDRFGKCWYEQYTLVIHRYDNEYRRPHEHRVVEFALVPCRRIKGPKTKSSTKPL